jgi:hypothetical protein
VLVVDEQGHVLSDDERLDALHRAGLEPELGGERHAWPVAGKETLELEAPIVVDRSYLQPETPTKGGPLMPDEERLGIYGIRTFEHRGETRNAWTQVGVAFRNSDDSLTLRFDYFPAAGDVRLNVRPICKPEEEEAAEGGL